MSVQTLNRVAEGYTYSGETNLVVMSCPICGVTYAIPAMLQRNARDRGEGHIQWFCPNGHQLGYHGKSAADRERESRRWTEQRLAAERDLRKDTERRLSAQKGATTRAKRRSAAGLCPCCKRSFKQIREHMDSQHPDFDPRA